MGAWEDDAGMAGDAMAEMTSAELREALGLAGGLVAQADIARRYHLSPSRTNELVHDPSFPKPLGRVATKTNVWLVVDVDAWMAGRHVGGSAA